MYKEFQQEQTQVVDRDSYGWFGVNYIYGTDLFLIQRKYIAFAPKLGYQKHYENGFLLDFYLGIGLRFVDTEIQSMKGILDEYIPYEETIAHGLSIDFDIYGLQKKKARYDFEPRKFTEIYIPFNFKIGWAF